MTCRECPYSTVDFTDDEDGYYCPFELRNDYDSVPRFMFHSGDKCHHNEERIGNDKHKFGHEVIVEASKVEPQHVKKLPHDWYDPSEDGLYELDQSKNENIFDENGKVKAEYGDRLNKNMLYNVCRYKAEASTILLRKEKEDG